MNIGTFVRKLPARSRKRGYRCWDVAHPDPDSPPVLRSINHATRTIGRHEERRKLRG